MKKEIIRQNVGVDVSKDDFHACLTLMAADLSQVAGGARRFSNTPKGFAQLSAWLSARGSGGQALHLTMEATGVYYESLAYYLQEQGHTVHVVLPNHARKYAQSLGVETKTDGVDAKVLAQLGVERQLRRWAPFSANFQRLKRLTRERDALLVARTTALNRRHAYRLEGRPTAATLRRSHEHIAFLEAHIGEIEREVAAVVEQDGPLKERLGYLQSIKGVGLLTAVTVVAETNGFAAISSAKQLTSYAGLDVKLRESGRWRGRSAISKKGNRYLRKALYLPTFSYVQHNPQVRESYRQLKERKGVPMVAAVAQQRKLLVLMYSLWKKQEVYQPAA